MSKTINLRGIDYEIQGITDIHAIALANYIKKFDSAIGQSEVGYVIKEVAIPDISDELIRYISRSDKYVVMLDSSELGSAIVAILEVFKEAELTKAIASGDKDAIATAKAESEILAEAAKALDSSKSADNSELEKAKALVAKYSV